MLPDLIDYLNGRVLFGVGLFFIIGGILSFLWWSTWVGTKFWDRKRLWKLMRLVWVFSLALYLGIWLSDKPLPIPTRIVIQTGGPGEKSPGAWAEGVAEGVKRRLRTSPSVFAIQDYETAPVLKRLVEPGQLTQVARQLGALYILEISEDSLSTDQPHAVRLKLRKQGWKKFTTIEEAVSPRVSLRSTIQWSAESVAKWLDAPISATYTLGLPDNPPDSLLSVHYLAYSLRRLNETALATAFFTAEAAVDSTWSSPRVELARTWLEFAPDLHRDEIRTTLLEAINIDRNNPEAYLLLADHFLSHKDWDEAESALKLTYFHSQNDPRALLMLSRLMNGRLWDLPYKNSEQLLYRTLQLAPGYENARLALVTYLRSVNRKQEGLQLLREGLKIDPTSRNLILTASAVNLELQEYEEAARISQSMVDRDPTDHQALYNLAVAHMWLKQYELAAALFDSSYRNGGSVDNLFYLGVTYQYQKDYPTALKWFEKRFAAAKRLDDQGAISARARINWLKDRMHADSLKATGWKPENPFYPPRSRFDMP
jgi:tetratricopeptide (TPR) repeat protein